MGSTLPFMMICKWGGDDVGAALVVLLPRGFSGSERPVCVFAMVHTAHFREGKHPYKFKVIASPMDSERRHRCH